MGDGNTTGIQIGLEAAVGPLVDGLVESILSGKGSTVSRLGILVGSVGSGGAKGRLGSGTDGVAQKLSAVLSDKSPQFVDLGALGNRDAVLVAKLLELGLAPSVNDGVSQVGIGSLDLLSSSIRLALGLEVGEARVAADRGNQLVAGGGLRGREAVGVKPLLEIRLGPGRVQPVSRIGSGFSGLFSGSLVSLASLLEKSVTGTRLGNCRVTIVSNLGCYSQGRQESTIPGMPCLSQKALRWESVQVSRIQSRALAHAELAASSVSYQLALTWDSRLSLFFWAPFTTSLPFDCR
jgi:hypothetical protein